MPDHWRPPPGDPDVMTFVNALHERFREALQSADSLDVAAWIDRISSNLEEIQRAHPENESAWECGLFWLVAELLEQQVARDPEFTRKHDAFQSHFPNHGHVIAAAHRQALDELPVRIGRYEILELLGEGAFGVVYLARAEHLDTDVALKTFGFGTDRSSIREEVRHARQLRHDSIVHIEDVGDDADYGWHIAMEFINGPPLNRKFTHRRPTIEETVRLITTISEALIYAHQKGIIHRDLKPANILIDSGGCPHIADFGLAIHKFNQRDFIGKVAGTLAYMAPEQLKGGVFDDKVDAWSLGVIFYELLTGQRPFQGTTENELRHQILHVEPLPPAEILPHQLWQACLGCLNKSRSERWGVSDLSRALATATILSTQTVAEAPATTSPISRRTRRCFEEYICSEFTREDIAALFLRHGFAGPTREFRLKADLVSHFYDAVSSDGEIATTNLLAVFGELLLGLASNCEKHRAKATRGREYRQTFTNLLTALRQEGYDLATDPSDASSAIESRDDDIME